MANNIVPDQEQFDQDLHCLLRHFCLVYSNSCNFYNENSQGCDLRMHCYVCIYLCN